MDKLTDENTYREDAADLRQRTENKKQKIQDQSLSDFKTMSPSEMHHLIHELQVHKIELEMQNDELLRAQLELDATKEYFYDLYNFAPVGYFSINEKGLIVEVNLTASTLLGVPQSSLIGQPISPFILEDDQDIYYFHRKRLFQTRAPQVSELRMVNNDKTIFWARLEETISFRNDSSEPVCRLILVGINELKEVQVEYKRFFDLVPDMVCIASTDGYLKKLNNTWQRVLGYSDEEMLTVPFLDLIHPDDKGATLVEIKNLMNGKISIQFINRYRHKNGSYRWFEWNSTPVKLKKEVLVFAVARDITERKLLENKLETSQRVLEKRVEARTAEIQQKTTSLEESNIALKVLIEQRMTDKINLEKVMVLNIKKFLIPNLERVQELSTNLQQKTYLELLNTNLNDIIAPFAPKLGNLLGKLSPAELEVVDLVKHGRSNKEIAELLSLSPSTITTYRQRIRKKLNLTNSKINLSTILNSN